MSNNLDKQYTDLLQDILDNGVTKQTRNGGTLSVFGRQIRHKMSEGFPLLTTKKMAFKTIVTELLWFLRGDTNIKYLVDNDCHIWDGDAYKNYCKNADDGAFSRKWLKLEESFDGFFTNEEYSLYTQEEFINRIKTDDEFAKKWGELGPVYGKQWRSWGSNIIDELGSVYTNEVDYDIQNGKLPYGSSNRKFVIDEIKKLNPPIDQIQNLINDLKTNPDSRRLMVNAWNVGELDQMVLPPCHYGFQVYTRELNGGERWGLLEKKVGKELFDSWVSEIVPFGGGLSEYLQSYNIPKRAISLMWNQRSVDTFLGLPFNIASYGLLLEIIAKEVNMIPDQLIGNLGDTHIYLNHIEQVKEQIGRDLTDKERYDIWFTNNYETGMERYFDQNKLPDFDDPYYVPTPKKTREPYPLPKVSVRDGIYCSSINDVILENYQSHPTIKASLSN